MGEKSDWKMKEYLNGLLVSLARERVRPAVPLVLLLLNVLLVGGTVDVVLLVKGGRTRRPWWLVAERDEHARRSRSRAVVGVACKATPNGFHLDAHLSSSTSRHHVLPSSSSREDERAMRNFFCLSPLSRLDFSHLFMTSFCRSQRRKGIQHYLWYWCVTVLSYVFPVADSLSRSLYNVSLSLHLQLMTQLTANAFVLAQSLVCWVS